MFLRNPVYVHLVSPSTEDHRYARIKQVFYLTTQEKKKKNHMIMSLLRDCSSHSLATTHTATSGKWYQSYWLNTDNGYRSKPLLGKSLECKY